jgi:fructokinase
MNNSGVFLLLQKKHVMTRTVYTIGETVYDIIFQDGGIKAGKAGGSMLNASVSLGRLGLNVSFISEVGNDELGDLITGFLQFNKVSTEYIDHFTGGKTPVALAFLDNRSDANYSFYKSYPEQRLQQKMPVVSKNDIVLFGSFFSISPAVRKPVLNFIRQARSAGAIIIYDPNIRSPHKNELPELLPMIFENFALADIVRASYEDFETIFDIKNDTEAYNRVKKYGDAALIFTRGGGEISLFANGYAKNFAVPEIRVVSTIGAGDSFNAGLVLSLIRQKISRSGLKTMSEQQWQHVIETGTKLSSQVCQSFDNYYSP